MSSDWKSGKSSDRPDDDRAIWFPAKRYGYGWGLPRAWQGWVVMLTYIALMILVATSPSTQPPLVFFSTVVLLTAALAIICWKKGEKPRWRWGDDKETPR